jgi:hypothetical protein
MHKIGDFIKKHAKSGSSSSSSAVPAYQPEGFPSKSDILRYRKQRGVNLGALIDFWLLILR